MKEPNERTILIEQAKQGDAAAFNALVREFRPRLEDAVRTRVGTHLATRVEIDDLLQETLLWAFKSVATFQWGGDDSFFRWLRGIAEHVILKAAQRENKRLVLPLLNDVANHDVTPSTALRRDERFERLQAALNSLSPDHRRVILLTRIERLTLDEIARRMERSKDAVKQLLRRALEQLRRNFGETESIHLPDRQFIPGEGDSGEE
jgi:RNA polymerase sigma-70 factor (ECF subfamily)